jgi:hypothetical protein
MNYLSLFLRGFAIVALVSFQTVSLARGDSCRVLIGAFIIGCFWFSNAGIAARPLRFAWLFYASGSSVGAYLGLWVGGL